MSSLSQLALMKIHPEHSLVSNVYIVGHILASWLRLWGIGSASGYDCFGHH